MASTGEGPALGSVSSNNSSLLSSCSAPAASGPRCPDRFGPWQTVHKRHMLWSADGTWGRLLQHVQTVVDDEGDIDWDIKSTPPLCAHQHAAGAPNVPPPTPSAASKGAAQRSVHVRKLHLAADGKCRPLSLIITPGQRADCTQFDLVTNKIRVPRMGPGRPRRTPASVAADKAYSNRRTVPTCVSTGSGM